MTTSVSGLHRVYQQHPMATSVAGILAWVVAYATVEPLSYALVGLLPVDPAGRLAGTLQFFFYDAPKVLLLLTGVVFAVGIVHTYVSPEKTRALLAGRRLGVGNVMAASLGVVTPFCSCSAVPLFIGFLQARVPLGVTFSFLVAAPMVNEVALAMLVGLLGWQVALLYLVVGLGVATVSGLIIGALKMEDSLEEWVKDLQARPPEHSAGEKIPWSERVDAGARHVREITGKVWPFILIGVGLGALIHGYVPEDFMSAIMGSEAWWSVPAAVLLGVPMYTNAAGVIPIVEALLAKGAALGTVLAFMMSVIALSAPEMIILRKVLKPRLIATFAGVVASGILLVGFLFNHIL